MGCLLVALVVLTLLAVILAAAWMWFGVAGAVVAGIVLLFLLGRFGPRMLAAGREPGEGEQTPAESYASLGSRA